MNLRGGLQRFGGAMMTPIAILPAMALLLAVGTVLPQREIAGALLQAGQILFEYLGLIVGIGIAIGLTGEGVAGLAAGLGYLVITGISSKISGAVNIGVLAGLVSGLLAAWLYGRFHATRLPDYLSFFGGQRSVLILAAVINPFVGLAFGYISPVIQAGLNRVTAWIGQAGYAGYFVYGALERLLIPTGLHHLLNGVILFLVGSYNGVQGDLQRFFAGDPTAGVFMAGEYPIKMFALPAAALAMLHEAGPAQRRAMKGLMASAALTTLLTGITEPVEFAFIFTAPILYVWHSFLAGTSFVVTNLLGIRHGFGSASGIVEYVVNLHLAERPLLLLPVGLAYGLIYYYSFRFLIRRLNLPTPGRLAEEALIVSVPAAKSAGPVAFAATSAGTATPIGPPASAGSPLAERAAGTVAALGGPANIASLASCLTRIRVSVRDDSLVDEEGLRRQGAVGLVRMGRGVLQVVFGTISDDLKNEMKRVMRG